jgi:Icc-related predicted phosphoesterase
MRIHIQSDVHSEMALSVIEPAVSSDVLVCAGDIGSLDRPRTIKRYFDLVRKSTDNIVWVLGNHEFYYTRYDRALLAAEKFAKEEGIFLLDEALGTNNLELNGVKFWGSTMWTDCNKSDPVAKGVVGGGLMDYDLITLPAENYERRKFNTNDTDEINARTRAKINWDADVIITHHAPVVIPHRKFAHDHITYGFCNTGLDQQIHDSNVKYWIYGHTHDSQTVDLNGTTIISNQHGYGGELSGPAAYDPNLIIEI